MEHIVDRPGAPVPVVHPDDRSQRTPPPWLRPGRLSPEEEGRAVFYRPGNLRLRVRSRVDRLVLVREARNAGWRARIAGREVEILPAAGMFFAVPVGPGESLLELRYQAVLGRGHAKSNHVPIENAVWFAYYVAISHVLFHLPEKNPIPLVSEKKDMVNQCSLFVLRGLGLREDILDQYFDSEDLEIFVEEWLIR